MCCYSVGVNRVDSGSGGLGVVGYVHLWGF